MNSPEIASRIRPHLLGLKPYSSLREELEGRTLTLLDSSENPYEQQFPHCRYPDPFARSLRSRVAAYKSVPEASVFLSNGSDEAIDLLYKATCTPGESNTLVCPPTFSMYGIQAAIYGVETRHVPLTPSFALDEAAVLGAMDEHTRLVWLCSPNNPTGNLLDADSIERILGKCRGWVVLDEAYIEYAEPHSKWLARLAEFPNLVILHTFSKAWGLAGLRVGMLFAHPGLVDVLNKVKLTYNISSESQRIALQALDNPEAMRESCRLTLQERTRVSEALAGMPGIAKVFPSQANFLLFQCNKQVQLFDYLLKNNVLIRKISTQPNCNLCLRVSIGTPDENTLFLNLVTQFFA